MLKVFEAFAGYGSQSLALKRAGIPHKVVAISEIDKYAITAYYSLHDSSIPNLGDISKIDVEDIPEHDLFTYSFPCQDISVAGLRKGIEEGTRSGLLYECKRIIEHCKPKYLLLENVKNLVGKKFKKKFDEWLQYLESLGYSNYWKVLNAKDYGVPQNRERIFVVSILGDELYSFPQPIPLTKCLADVLEEDVDKKYYLSEKVQQNFKLKLQGDNIIGSTKPDNCTRSGERDVVYHDQNIIGALAATDYKQPKQILQLGLLDIKGNEQVRRVYGAEGISPTLNTMQGGNRQPKVLLPLERDFRIRKITPRECFRLMGLADEDIDKIQATGLSNTQQYKIAGNSIVIDVLVAIFQQLFTDVTV